MTKLEKVVKGLECCTTIGEDDFPICNECPYFCDETCPNLDEMHMDALELLKAKYKPRESRKMLPCKCGCKRREHWYGSSYDNSEGLKCTKCGFEVWGNNAIDVIRKWNEAVKINDSAKV